MSATRLELNLKAKPKAIPVAAAAAVTGKPFLPLQVGKRYVRKDGAITEPVKLHNNGSYAGKYVVIGEWVHFQDTGQCCGWEWDPGYPKHIVGEYVEQTPFDKMVQEWLKGKDILYQTPHAPPGSFWYTFPKAANIAGNDAQRIKYLKGYENQFTFKELA